ncbi:MAG TPA: AAA family ATPase [Kineosporiaceae bacterium]|jgi:pilus assembly protein CpaE|nr:AAA family ATPase [Kineosporiaceae bacterium]
MTTICDLDPVIAQALSSAVGESTVVTSLEALRQHLEADPAEDTVVLGPTVDQSAAFRIAEQLRLWRPALGVILVRARVDTGLLAEAMRAGVRDVVGERNIAGLHEAVRRTQGLAAAMRQQTPGTAAPGRPRGRIITVFSAKGGCGKTTLATNMAAALADRGRREVCLVDLDLAFGDVAIALQLFPAHTIADAVPLGENVDFGAVQALLTPHSPGLTTLVAPVEPGTGEGIPASLVSHVLQVLRDHFDYVIVDTPPAFDDHVLAAFDLSDVVALIATLDIPALKNLKLTLETMDLLNFPRDRWRIVLNRADSKVGLAIGEVEKSLRATISAQLPSSRDVPAAINRGVPIVLDDPRHAVSVAIKTFAEQYVANVQGGPAGARGKAPKTSERRGLLRRRSKA